MLHSHGKFLINGGFLAGKIIYFYGPFSMAMLNNQRCIHMGVSMNGGTPLAGWLNSWKVQFFHGDDLD